MGEPARTRTKQFFCYVSEEEYAEIKAVQRSIGQTYRFFLLLGVRHARQVWEAEQRRQPQQD